MPALRSSIWRNLNVHEEPPPGGPIVLFSSSAAASNGRRIANESLVAEAARRFFASHAPHLAFVRRDLAALSMRDEALLLRRTRVFISLFSASLPAPRRVRVWSRPRVGTRDHEVESHPSALAPS